MKGDKKKFPKELLRDLVNGDALCPAIENKLIDSSRWSLDYQLVFLYEGKYYTTVYSRGATEQQEMMPFEDEGDEIECVEVEPVEKTVTVYE